MKKLAIVAAAVAMFSVAASGTVMAKTDKATAYCSKQAKKHHVTAEKMESYMKTCVEKHQKKRMKKAAKPAAKPAAPAAGTTPAGK